MAETKSFRIRLRSFLSLLVALSFLIMTVSGLILFIVPPGRIANWLDWRLLGLSKGQWGDMHITTSLLFVLAGAGHIWMNWKALLNYFRERASKTLTIKSEMVAAALLVAFFTVGGTYQIPPLNYVIELNEYVRDSWIRGPEDEPVVSHAERLPLSRFLKKVDIELEPAMEELARQGIRVADPDEKLLDIARNNNTSPAGIYRRIEFLQKDSADK